MARKTPHREKGPSQRQLRVGEEIRHVLAGVMMRGELHDPALDGVSVTVTEVRISPDLKHATVFSLPLAGSKVDDVLKGLNRSAPFLRSQVGKAMQLRYAPTLTFVADKSFDEAHHIEELLKSEKVARDLKAAHERAEREAGDGED
jgi:ribosome-binding factor A